MKTLGLFGLLLLSSVFNSPAATLYYWDINGATAGASSGTNAAGTWGTSSVYWSTSSAGTATTQTFPAGNTTVFSAGTNAIGTFNVVLSAGQTVDSVTVEEGNPQLGGAGVLTVSGTGVMTVGSSSKLSISNVVAGTVGITKGGSGVLALAGNNTFTGPVNLNSGTLAVVTGASLGTGGFNFNGGLLRYDGTANTTLLGSGSSVTIGTSGGSIQIPSASANATCAAIFSGTGNLSVGGNGILTLSGSSTYSGNTIVNGGTLKVVNTAGSATGTGAVQVNSGATLSGGGHIAGNVTLSGALKPGASPGTIYTGSETWNGGASYTWEVNNVTGGEGIDPGWDLVNVSGSLSIAATSSNAVIINVVSLTPNNGVGAVTNFNNSVDYTWRIVTTTSGIIGFNPGSIIVNKTGFLNTLDSNGKFVVEVGGGGKDLLLKYVHSPKIVSAPVNDAKAIGGTATFSASATGTAPLGYQWQKGGVNLVDGGAISGTQTTVLTINNLTIGDAGDYTFIATSPYGSATSGPPASLIIITPPVITLNPSSQTKNQGNTVLFTIVASGLNLNYSWTKDGQSLRDEGNIFGSTTSTLTISNLSGLDAGAYAAQVSNVAGSVSSADAFLDVIIPPTISTQLAGRVLPVGDATALSLSVNGTPPFTFQWKKDGVLLSNGPEISGADSDTLVFHNLQMSDSGSYSLFVTNQAGSVVSSNVSLVVYNPSCTPSPVGILAWWTGEYSVDDSVNGKNGFAISPVGYNAGKVGQTFSFDGISNYVEVADSPYLQPVTMTLEAWVRGNSPDVLDYIVSKSLDGGKSSYAFYAGTSSGLQFYVTVADGSIYTSPDAGRTIWDGNFHHVVGTYDGSYVRLYVDGDEVGGGTAGTGLINYGKSFNNGNLFIGAFDEVSGGYRFAGDVDEVTLYGRALAPAEIQTLYAARGAGKCSLPQVGSVPSTIYYSRSGGSDGTVWRAQGDGSSDIQITTGAWPQLSPDGKYILFQRGNGGYSSGNLWIRNLSTGVETLIFVNTNSIAHYGWTGDSGKIVFDSSCGIQQINRDGSGIQTLFSVNCGDAAPKVRFLDGKIVFMNTNGTDGLFLANGDGSNRQMIPNTLPNDMWPIWSPDGQWISFVNGVNLFKIKPDGSTRTQLTFLSAAGDMIRSVAAWTPDSSKIICAGKVAGLDGMFAISAHGTGPTSHIVTASGASIDMVGSVAGYSTCTPSPSGLVNWWRGDNSASDSILGLTGSLQNGADYGAGKVGQAFVLDGVDDSVSVPGMLSPSGPVTYEAWVKFTGGNYARGTYNTILEFGNDSPWFGVDSDGSLDLFNIVRGGSMPTNGWVHVAYTWNGLVSSLYINSSLVATSNYAPPNGGSGLGIGQHNGDTAWMGAIDEVSVYNRALGSQEIQNIYEADLEGKCVPPSGFPVITVQPLNVSTPRTYSASFNVSAVGDAPLTYQWRKDGVTISDSARVSGAGTPSLTVSNLEEGDTGFFSVVVSNSIGSVTSVSAYLDVLIPPVIDVQPQSTTNPPGSTVTFAVVAHGGTQPLSYVWKKNGYPISGATSSNLALSNVTTNDNGSYVVDISNSQGSVQSLGATLTVFSIGGDNYDNFIGYWRADGNANDSFGANHGILQGTAGFSALGKINQAFLFDGTNASSVMIPDSGALQPENVTVEAWVKFDSLDSTVSGGAENGTQYLVFKKNSRTTQFEGYALVKGRGAQGDFLSFAVASASGNQVIANSVTTITAGVFYHVVGSYNGSAVSIYINGALEDSKPVSFPLNYGTTPLYFGSSGETWDGKLSGVLDEIRLYGRALSPLEVRAHFTQGNLGFIGLQLVSTNFVNMTSSDRGLGLAISGGSAFVSGVVGSSGGDAMISRFNLPVQSTNSPVWTTNWPGLSGADRFAGVCVGSDGIYFAGDSFTRTADGFGSKENKGMVVKFGVNGPTNSGFGGSVWDKQVPASPGAFSYSGKETINGLASTTQVINDTIKTVLYATGSSQRSSANQGRTFLTKLLGDGTILWTVTDVQATTTSSDSFSSGNAIALLNGNVFVAGRNDDGGSPKAVLSKYNSTGGVLWTVGTSSGLFNAVTSFGGSLYLAGSTATNGSSADFLIEKRDETGALLWSRTFDRAGGEDILTGVVGIGSRVYAVGSTKGIEGTSQDAAILEIDAATGDLVSTTLYGGNDDDSANAAATDGTDLYVAGETKSYGGSGNNVMLLRYKVSQPAVNLAIVTTSLPVAVVSNAYSVRLQAAGGVPPYTWTVATNSAALPGGLALTTDGAIAGIPIVPSTSTVIIQASDSGTPPNISTQTFALTVVSAKTPPSVNITAPSTGAIYEAPASIAFSVSASDADGLDHIDFYKDGYLVDSARGLTTAATANFNVNSLAAGSYDFYAVAYDYYQTPATSAVTHVTVNGTGLNAIDFEAFDISRGAVAVTEPAISGYLNGFGITISDVTAGSYLVVNRDENFGSGSLVSASSGKNLFTQTGKNGAVSYTLNFNTAAASFRFTRVKILGSAVGVIHPGWRATAYNGTNILGSIGESAMTSYQSIPEQAYVLYGPNITSVKIEADNYNYANFTSALLDDFVIVTNSAVINNQPPTINLLSPTEGSSFTAPAQVTIAANASDSDGEVASIKIYLGRTLLTTIPGASGTYTLENLAPSSSGYQIRAEAIDNQGAVKSSQPVTFYVTAAPGVNVINFDAVDASTKNVGTTNLATYLAVYGVTVSNITTGSRLEVANVKNISGGAVMTAVSPDNVLAQSSRGGAVSYTLNFSASLQNLRFTRPKLLAGSYGVTFPQWRARAYSASGYEIASVGENLFYSATNVPAQVFDLGGANIVSVRFDSDGQSRSTVSGLVIDDLILNTNTISRPLSISITSPVNNSIYSSAPATVTVEASVAGTTSVNHVDFYAGPLLIGSASSVPYSVTRTNVYPGSYELRAIAVDNFGNRVVSEPVQISVSGGSTINNSTFINFDTLSASGGAVTGEALETYLGSFGVSLESTAAGTPAVFHQQSLMSAAYGSGVVANSPQNIFTQTGSGSTLDFSLSFTQPLTQFQFTRVKLIAGVNGVTHPSWQAWAYDSAGNVVSTASESFTSSSADVSSQSFTLTGQGIVRVRFESVNRGAANFAAVVMDDWILTRSAGNLPPAVSIITPMNGESFYAPADVTLKASAADPDGNVAQVAFYANGSLIGVVTNEPYELRGTNVPLGAYLLTAVATDDVGATNQSSPVRISIIPSPFTFAIWRQPQNQSVARGGAAYFAVVATGTNTIAYQWQFEGVNIAGATNAVLTFSNVDTAQVGNYRVIVTSETVSLTSSNAVLTIGDSPSITVQPVGQTVNAGETVTFTVTASGAGALSYQWTLNGNPIPGATGSSYTIQGAQPFNSGFYQAFVANALGYAQSDKANLTVIMGNATPSSADNFADRISINPLLGPVFGNNEQATKETGEADHVNKRGGKSIWFTWHATFSGMMSLSTKGSSFDTLLAVYTGDSITNLTLVAADDDGGGFFTSQVTFNAVEGTDYQIVVDGFKGAYGTAVLGLPPGEGYRVLDYAAGEQVPYIVTQPASQFVDAGGTAVLTMTASGPEPLTYQWYLNGNAISGATQSALTIPSFNESSVGRYYVVVANDAGSAQSAVATLELASFTEGLSGTTSQDKPGDMDLIIPEDAGEERGDPGSRAGTSRGYTTTQVFSTVGASKEADEPNHCGVVGGASVWYGYLAPASGTISIDTVGSTFDTILAVYTTPTGFFDFATLQSKGCTNVSGEGGEVVTFTAVSNKVYYIAVDGVAGATGTVHLNINLGTKPTITSSPQSATVAHAGSNAVFSVSASGSTNLYYRWKFNNGDISGQTNVTLTVTNVQAGLNTGLYSVVVSNLVGMVTSSPVTLDIASIPAITTQPASTNGVFGKSVTFTVAATGTGPLRYQWQFDEVNIAGATTSAYTKSGLKLTNAGEFRVVITNIAGAVTSSVATLAIVPAPPFIKLPAATARYTNVGSIANFSGFFTNNMGVTAVQYQVNGGAFQNANIVSTNWSAAVTLNRAGTNVIGVKAVNASGDSVVTNRSVYVYQTIPVSVIINSPGSGAVAPATTGVTNGQRLEIGKSYSITATPVLSSGNTYVFTNWSGSVSGTTNKITFQMQSNLVIEANFILNPFIAAKGTYNGLFTNASYDYKLSGFVTVGLQANQSYSGALYVEGDKCSFSGKCTSGGRIQTTVSRNIFGKPPLTLDLTIQLGADEITGTVTDGETTAQAFTQRAVYSSTNTQTNYLGKYTMILPHDTNANTAPAGYGFGLINVLTNGNIVVAGSTLGDNVALAPIGLNVAKDGRWAVYSGLYSSKYVTHKFLTPAVSVTNTGFRGAIMGWLQFSNNAAIGGNLKWFKTEVTNSIPAGYLVAYRTNYPRGFTNELEVTGLRYTPVTATHPVLSGLSYPAPSVKVFFTNAVLTLEGGNVSSSITNNLFVRTNSFILPSTNSLWTGLKVVPFSGSIAVANGSVSGSFYHPQIKKALMFKGAVLQSENRAYGVFQGYSTNGLTTNQTGSISILSSP